MRLTFKFKTLLLIVIIIGNVCVANEEYDKEIQIGGFYKSTFSFLKSPYDTSKKDLSQLYWNNLGRIKLTKDFRKDISLEAAYEISALYSKHNEAIAPLYNNKVEDYRVYDLDDTFLKHSFSTKKVNRIDLYQNLDRLFVTYVNSGYDLYAGRQPISFGSGRTVNPTDVLVPYSVNAIDTEERRGVDAIRVKAPLGEMSEFDSGIVLGDSFDSMQAAFFVNLRYPIKDWDTALMAMVYRENYLFGVDLQGSIKDFGVWLEAASNLMNDSRNYFRMITGLEYSWSDFSFFSEYYYNGAGTDEKSNYLINVGKKAYTVGGVYLLSRNYLIPGINYQIHPLISLSASIIANINDGSTLNSLKAQYSMSDNLYLDLGTFIGSFGGSSAEFSYYADLIYLSLRYYF